MNHLREGVSHEAKHRCRYSAHYDNRIYTCKVGPAPPALCALSDQWLRVWSYDASVSPRRRAMRAVRRWSWFRRPQRPPTRPGSVWPSTPGPGESWRRRRTLMSSRDHVRPRWVNFNIIFSGMWSSVQTVQWSTEAGSTGTATRTLSTPWSVLRYTTFGRGWEFLFLGTNFFVWGKKT